MWTLETDRKQNREDIGLINKLTSADYNSALSFLVSSADAALAEKELIDKWGVAGYEGAVLLLMSRKTLKIQKAEVILQKWMNENDVNAFTSKISEIIPHLEYFRIKLGFELNDVLLSVKLMACSKLILGIIEEHHDTLLKKYKQLVYKDDFGNLFLKDFDRELSVFYQQVLLRRYDHYNLVADYAKDIIYRKFLRIAESNIIGVDKSAALKIAQGQFECQYESELENFAKYFCLVHFRRLLFESNF